MENQPAIEAIIDYHFTDSQLLAEALQVTGTATSFAGHRPSNRRLALLGDALLRLAILDEWYPKGTSIGRTYFYAVNMRLTGIGDGTNLVRDGGCNNVLSDLALDHGLA